jgi:hypothetical protein
LIEASKLPAPASKWLYAEGLKTQISALEDSGFVGLALSDSLRVIGKLFGGTPQAAGGPLQSPSEGSNRDTRKSTNDFVILFDKFKNPTHQTFPSAVPTISSLNRLW